MKSFPGTGGAAFDASSMVSSVCGGHVSRGGPRRPEGAAGSSPFPAPRSSRRAGETRATPVRARRAGCARSPSLRPFSAASARAASSSAAGANGSAAERRSASARTSGAASGLAELSSARPRRSPPGRRRRSRGRARARRACARASDGARSPGRGAPGRGPERRTASASRRAARAGTSWRYCPFSQASFSWSKRDGDGPMRSSEKSEAISASVIRSRSSPGDQPRSARKLSSASGR